MRSAVIPLFPRLVGKYIKSQWRGSTRLTFSLANYLDSLRHVPVYIEDWPPVYMDIRNDRVPEWVAGNPWPKCPYETDEQAVMARFVKPGMAATDIGANIGIHSAFLSQLLGSNGKLYMFEPNQALIPCLKLSAETFGNAELFPIALSETEGEIEFFVPNDHSCASFFNWTHDDGAPVKRVKTKRLDSFELPHLDFIKCDVEAAELMVFKGATGILDREDAPVILYEALNNFGLDTFAATRFLLSLPRPKYKVFRIEIGGNLVPFDNNEGNLLAVPGSGRWKHSILGDSGDSS